MRIENLTFRRTSASTALAVACLSILATPLAVRCAPAFTDANWVSMGNRFYGPNAIAEASAVDASGNLYIGGSFTNVCGVPANSVAKWNGTNWSALGTGLRVEGGGYDPRVVGLAVVGNDLYACGTFTKAGAVTVNGLAKWNGSVWSALGTGVDGVIALAALGTNLIVGGGFTTIGGIAATNIAQWNGTTWSALGSGVGGSFDGSFDLGPVGVFVLAVSGSDLYAGGHFSKAGGVAATNIAKWNGSAWSALGPGLYGHIFNNAGPNVYALAVSGSDVYAGGDFGWTGNTYIGTAAKWNGSTWSALGDSGGPGSFVFTMAVQGSDLYAGGIVENGIAKWNGVNWSPVGEGLDGTVAFLSVSGTNVYAVGDFSIRGWSYVAKWDGNRWSELGAGPGINHKVSTTATSGSDLYISGEFDRIGEKIANRIAKWDGTNWSALGSGLDYEAWSLSMAGNKLYALGLFTQAGGIPVKGFACWNGSTWLPMGPVTNEISSASAIPARMAVIGNDLYVGGSFTSIGGIHATNIAKWNGSVWSAPGSEIKWEDVDALTASGNDLYVGGTVRTPDSIVNQVAKWNGSNWTILGTNPPATFPIGDLAVTDHFVYAHAGVNEIHKWDGTNWTRLPFEMDHPLNSLVTSGSDLYIGGGFPYVTFPPNPTQVIRNYIARWDGTNLTALGSGLDGPVVGMAILGNTLYAGGVFTMAGGKSSAYLAKAIIAPGAGRFQNPTFSPATGFNCIFTDGGVGYPYHIQASPTMAPGSWVNVSNFTYTAPIVVRDPSAASGTKRFFRAVSP